MAYVSRHWRHTLDHERVKVGPARAYRAAADPWAK
jgi:hypothetical protein